MSHLLTFDVLRHYPQVYLACHVEHTRARSNPHGLSDKDVTLLGHLEEDIPLQAGRLARHLGIRPSTLTAQLQKLEARGYLKRSPNPGDRRNVDLHLTPDGAKAMAGTSILDPTRVDLLLNRLSNVERKRAVDGLALLARAARQLQIDAPRNEV